MAAAAPLLVGTAAAQGPVMAGMSLAGATSGLFGAGGALSLGATLGTLFKAAPLVSGLFASRQEMQGAQLQSQGAELTALQLESQAEYEKTRSMQEEAQRRQRLNQILNNQMAMTAGRGVAIGSGSDLAIASFSEQEAQEESDISMSDSEYRQRQLRSQATQARLGGGASLMNARASATNRLVSGAMNTFERTNLSTR
jgi:hypothetical protein